MDNNQANINSVRDPIKEAIRSSNESERRRKRAEAEKVAAPLIQELKSRVSELEAEKSTLDETCKAVQASMDALRNENETLKARISEFEVEKAVCGKKTK
jgi:molecular chaperone GrpE (heat shock protein)